MILVDGSNFAWRAFYTGRGLASRGRPTGMLHVSLSMLASFGDLFKPQRVVFVWDSRSTWRKQILPEYKANRRSDDPAKVEGYKQMGILRELLTRIGFSQASADGYEADDVAAYLVRKLRGKYKVTLISADKDWSQLLQHQNVMQVRGWKGKKLDLRTVESLKTEFGVSVHDWVRYLALTGDKVDNVPQVRRGMGPVAAKKVLAGDLQLTAEEEKIWKRNIELIQLKDTGYHVTMVNSPRTDEGWKYMEEVMSEYELFKLWGERGRIWQVGGWRG